MRRRGTLAVMLVLSAAAGLLSACANANTYALTATFDDVGDLQSRGSVQTADVRIGEIGAIRLTKDFKARVTLHIHDAVRVPRASTAVLRTTSLLGEKFVELRPEGDPGQGPFFRNGDVVQKTAEAPELEFVADQLVSVLGGVPTTDLANIVNTGAVGFGGRGPELHALIGDLATISDSLASRTSQIGTVIDNLDRATQTLAGGAGDIKDLLSNLATTTGILSTDRDRAIHALDELSRLARVQNQVLDKYHGDIDRQIKQVDAIVSVASGQTAQLGTLVDFLDQFLTVVPKAIPADFNQVYMWLVPCAVDKRSPAGCP